MKVIEVSNQKIKLGRQGESMAETFLKQRGVTILARNARTAYGELDLVGVEAGLTVIFEVKTRRSLAFGFPEAAVSAQKRRHLSDAAAAYIQAHPELPAQWRIDVIAIRLVAGSQPEIEWFENAVS